MASSWMEDPTDKDVLLLKRQLSRFRCDDFNASFMHVQRHFYRVRQVEPGALLEQLSSWRSTETKKQQHQHVNKVITTV